MKETKLLVDTKIKIRRQKTNQIEKSNKEASNEDNNTVSTTKKYNKTPINIDPENLKKKIKDIL